MKVLLFFAVSLLASGAEVIDKPFRSVRCICGVGVVQAACLASLLAGE